ncbi:hypothetical protein AVEN_6301-1 [Araneus ventricosus]|uniref:Uncharacterized protein n=1 Tax=Araneus ventricosus TaxID=182803 RepID=A0A4Y2K2D9_ARAVE|nr:hypothetical protein AVEN_6301-1 [Araneus ventricosus]
MTRTTPELAPPSPNFRATPTGGPLATTYDLAYNRPHTRRIFGGIGFRNCDPPVPRSRPYHYATAASNNSRTPWILFSFSCSVVVLSLLVESELQNGVIRPAVVP